MRARLGILFTKQQVEIREIVLRDKPDEMLSISPKGTVPVLKLADSVIDESLDIIKWALGQNDPHGLLNTDIDFAYQLINQNDTEFKYWLDRYKYFNRFPEQSQADYCLQCQAFLKVLNDLLAKNRFLLGNDISIADISIMPFVRQFAHVNRADFQNLPYSFLQKWLENWLAHDLFILAMRKYKVWHKTDQAVLFSASS